MDIDKLFKIDHDSGQIRFIGNKLEVIVSERYESHGCLDISDKVSVMAIFDMIVDDSIYLGYYLPTIIVTEPSDIEPISEEDGKFYKLTYYKNDVFITYKDVVKQGFLGYVLFYEFLYIGQRPKFITYEYSSKIFDLLKTVCGVKLPVNRVVFEMIASHLHRDMNDLKVLYRLTDMKLPPRVIPLLDVAHAATSTTARVVGSYFNAAVDSSLINASDINSKLEDLLRL